MSDHQPEAERLLREVRALADADEQAQLLALAEQSWAEIAAREALPEDAETARFAMLACVSPQLADRRKAALWRMRSFVKASEAGWMHGVSALVMAETLRVQGSWNDDRPSTEPGYVVHPEAFDLLDLMRPFMGDEPSAGAYIPSGRWVSRQYHEKRAFLLTLAGRWDEAAAGYREAQEFVGDDRRGQLKVELGLRAAEFMATDEPEARTAAGDRTGELAAEAAEAGQVGLARDATENAARMAAGRTDLTPYEVL